MSPSPTFLNEACPAVSPTIFLNDASSSNEEEEQRLFTQPEAEAEAIDNLTAANTKKLDPPKHKATPPGKTPNKKKKRCGITNADLVHHACSREEVIRMVGGLHTVDAEQTSQALPFLQVIASEATKDVVMVLPRMLLNDFDRRYHPTTQGQLKYEREALVGHGNRYISTHPYFFKAAFLDPRTHHFLREIMEADNFNQVC